MPATLLDVKSAAARLRFVVPEAHEEDYIQLLQNTDAAVAELFAIPDYIPFVDTERFPRREVHRPKDEDNLLRGWAWKANIGGAEEGILAGRTVVVKDTICVAGVPLLFGTDAIEDLIPEVDATVITRVLEKGGQIVGKATCENFSHGAVSFSSAYGPVENPHAVGFSTGGSSSGCGALIGSGVVDMGIGGDQGGSIRIPASLCGIVGLKPTFGLVPYTGVLSSDATVDTVGPMARSVSDCALLLEAIAGCDGIDDRQLGAPLPADVLKYSELLEAGREKGVKGMKIGVLKEGFGHASMDSEMEKVCREALKKFEELGAVVEEVSIPLHANSGSMCHVLNKFSSSQTRQGRQAGRRGLHMNSYWAKLLPWDQGKYDKAKYFVTGTSMSAEYGWNTYPTIYGHAINLSRRLSDEYDAVLAEYDVICMPTVTQPARRHLSADAGPLAWSKAARDSPGIVSNTAASSLTGHPALTIPVGFTPPQKSDVRSAEDAGIKLPVGLMLVGKKFDEATVLKVGDAWERAFDRKKL
ncbi:amidase, partial [Phenoliferia sp. Uapishka_3]